MRASIYFGSGRELFSELSHLLRLCKKGLSARKPHSLFCTRDPSLRLKSGYAQDDAYQRGIHWPFLVLND